MGPNIGALVASVGSGGSLCGTGRALKAKVPGLKVVAVDAVGSVLFHQPNTQRLQSGHGNTILPSNVDHRAIDEVHWVSDGECFDACAELARREGVFGGGSSGAAYVVASWVASQLPEGQHVVFICPDRGDRYGETIYSQAWLEKHGVAGQRAGPAPTRIRYGVDVAKTWSWAPLPHDGSVPYVAPSVQTSGELTRGLGLP